jgi:hypothetical protein
MSLGVPHCGGDPACVRISDRRQIELRTAVETLGMASSFVRYEEALGQRLERGQTKSFAGWVAAVASVQWLLSGIREWFLKGGLVHNHTD